MTLYTTVSTSGFFTDGAIEFENNEFIVFKKDDSVAVLFGAIGSALASRKEVMRFSLSEIRSYQIIKKIFRKILHIDLVNGKFVEITLNSEILDELMPLLETVGQQAN